MTSLVAYIMLSVQQNPTGHFWQTERVLSFTFNALAENRFIWFLTWDPYTIHLIWNTVSSVFKLVTPSTVVLKLRVAHVAEQGGYIWLLRLNLKALFYSHDCIFRARHLMLDIEMFLPHSKPGMLLIIREAGCRLASLRLNFTFRSPSPVWQV